MYLLIIINNLIFAGYEHKEDCNCYCKGNYIDGGYDLPGLSVAMSACNADDRCKCFYCFWTGRCFLTDSSGTSPSSTATRSDAYVSFL